MFDIEHRSRHVLPQWNALTPERKCACGVGHSFQRDAALVLRNYFELFEHVLIQDFDLIMPISKWVLQTHRLPLFLNCLLAYVQKTSMTELPTPGPRAFSSLQKYMHFSLVFTWFSNKTRDPKQEIIEHKFANPERVKVAKSKVLPLISPVLPKHLPHALLCNHWQCLAILLGTCALTTQTKKPKKQKNKKPKKQKKTRLHTPRGGGQVQRVGVCNLVFFVIFLFFCFFVFLFFLVFWFGWPLHMCQV